ncbi:MAG: proprotein convertase P-domain-containing protein [Deltaproteobacteria bacterium]|nr:proprotein convertase P-domain-containing protein [Deltaproteobacteria bacterium]
MYEPRCPRATSSSRAPHAIAPARLSWTLLVAVVGLGACGDDGGGTSTTSTGSGTTAGTTQGAADSTTSGGDSTTGAPSSSSSTAGETSSGPGDSSGTTSDATGSSGSGSESGTTGTVAPFDVPFNVLDPYPLPLTTRVQPGWTVITTAAEWDARTGIPVPAGVNFPQQWLVYGSRGPQPFPGHDLQASALTWDAETLVVDGTAAEPGGDCDTYQFTWPADTLLVIDALDVPINDFDDLTTPQVQSCAAGASESMQCSLAAPCATGLSCAGLIRSTVLINNPGGLCLSSGLAGVFPGGPLVIPSNGASAEVDLQAAGLATVDMDVVIWVELDHTAPQELVIELRNPSGNQVMVANLQTSPLHPGGVGIVPTGFSGDESVNGTWSLVVRDDVVNATNGSVLSWQLEIMSRFD